MRHLTTVPADTLILVVMDAWFCGDLFTSAMEEDRSNTKSKHRYLGRDAVRGGFSQRVAAGWNKGGCG